MVHTGNSFIYRFNRREELAFEVVFKATYLIMIGLAIKITNNKNEAEDVVIVAYRKLWESDAKFDSYIQIRAYISKVVKNECYNYLARLRKTINRIRELTPDIEIEEDVYTKSSDSAELQKLIKRLPPHYKRLLLLQLNGYTDKDISGIENISVAMVSRRRWRAIKMIKSYFQTTQ